MGSNFQNSRNSFSVKVVYPSKENHAQHQTIQSTPTDSTLKLRGHVWYHRFYIFFQQMWESPDFCWWTSDLINTNLRAAGSSWCYPNSILPTTSSFEFWASWANLNSGSYIPIWFPSGLTMCFYLCLCSTFELFQHAKSSRNYLRRSA